MNYKITTEQVHEVTDFPAYFRYKDSNFQFAKVIDKSTVIYAMASESSEMCTLEMRSYLNDNYQPCEPELFYQIAALAMQRINAGCDIVSLELQEGAYAD